MTILYLDPSQHSRGFNEMAARISALKDAPFALAAEMESPRFWNELRRKRIAARKRAIARKRIAAIVGICALFAFVILPAGIAFGYAMGEFLAPDSGPSYSLAHDIAGQRYIIDHGLTWEDCSPRISGKGALSCIAE